MSDKKAKEMEQQKGEGQAAAPDKVPAAPGTASPAAGKDSTAPALNKIIALIPISRTAQEVLKTLSQKQLADVIYTDTADETVEVTKRNLPCMVLLSIANNSEITSRYQVFNKLDSAMDQQGLKVFTVTPLKSQKLSLLFFKRFGTTEYVLEPQTARAMQFKATQLLKNLDIFRREEAERAQAPTAMTSVKRKAASALGQDVFLIKGSGMKKTGKNWVADVDGPDPSLGEWVQHSDPGNPQTAWRWVPNAEKEAQASGEKPKNGWVLVGNKPTYNPESGKWAMSSETPSLTLHENGKAVAEKITQDEKGNITITEDSPLSPELSATEGKAPDSKELNASEGKAEEKPDLSALLEAPKPGSPRKLQLKKKAEEKASEFNDKRGKDPEARGVNDKRGADADEKTPFNDHTGGGKAEAKAVPGDLAEGKTESAQKNLVNTFGKDPGPKGVNPLNAGKDEKPKAAKDFVDQKGPESAMKEARITDPKAAGKDYHGKEEARDSKELSATEAKASATGVNPLKPQNPPQDTATTSAEAAGTETSAKAEASVATENAPSATSSKESVDKKTQAVKLRTKMKEHLDEISKRLAVPLTDKMNMMEEDEIRGELGLRNRPEIKVKELSLKKRNADVKAMRAAHAKIKEELDSLEQQIAKQDKPYDSSAQQAAAAAEVMQFKNDAPDATGVNGSKSFDGGEQQNSAEGSKGKKNKEKAERDSTSTADDYQYMPESGLKPAGNAWDKAPPYYLYLDAKIRFQGFQELKELLPLWIFKGSQVPELLDRTKQWRFKGALPIQASKVEEIPAEVREFLQTLCKDLKSGNAAEKAKDALAAGSEFAASPDPVASSTSSTANASGGAAVSEKPSQIPVEDSAVAGASEASTSPEAANAPLENSTPGKENPAPGREHPVATADAPAASAEKPAAPAAENKPAPLRLVKNDEAGEKSAEKNEFTAVQKTYVEKLEGKNELKSDAVKKFLDRQKDRKDEPAAKKNETKTAAAPKLRLVSPPEEKSVFLGLFVAIADSFTPGKTKQASMERILNSMETSFGDCFVAFTGKPEAEQKAKILYRSRSTPGTDKTVVLSSGLCVPVERVNGVTKNVVGYLFLTKTGNRKGFDSMEESTVKEVAEKIWPLLELSEEEKKPA